MMNVNVVFLYEESSYKLFIANKVYVKWFKAE
jgi:hypothetical protein